MLIAPCTLVFGRLHRIVLIVHGRRRAREVVDLVYFDE